MKRVQQRIMQDQARADVMTAYIAAQLLNAPAQIVEGRVMATFANQESVWFQPCTYEGHAFVVFYAIQDTEQPIFYSALERLVPTDSRKGQKTNLKENCREITIAAVMALQHKIYQSPDV